MSSSNAISSTGSYALAKTETGTIPIHVPADLKNDPVTKAVYDNIMGNIPKKPKPVTVYCKVCNLEFSSQVVLDTHLAGSKHQRKLKSKELMKSLEETESGFERNSVSGVIRCTICDITVNSPQLLATHVAGNKHKSKKGKRENGDEGGTPAKKLCATGATKQSNGASSATAASSSSSAAAADSSESANKPRKKERAPIAIDIPACVTKLEDTKTGGKFLCNPCQAHCNSDIQLSQHLSSKKHLEKVSDKKKFPISSSGGRGGGGGGGSSRPWKGSGGRGGRSSSNLTSRSSSKWDGLTGTSSMQHSSTTGDSSFSSLTAYGQSSDTSLTSSGYTDSYGLSSLSRTSATDYSSYGRTPSASRGASSRASNGGSFSRAETYAVRTEPASYGRSTAAYGRNDTYTRSTDYGADFAATRAEDLGSYSRAATDYARAATDYATQSYGAAEYAHGYGAGQSVGHAPARGMPFTYTQPLSHNFVSGGSIL